MNIMNVIITLLDMVYKLNQNQGDIVSHQYIVDDVLAYINTNTTDDDDSPEAEVMQVCLSVIRSLVKYKTTISGDVVESRLKTEIRDPMYDDFLDDLITRINGSLDDDEIEQHIENLSSELSEVLSYEMVITKLTKGLFDIRKLKKNKDARLSTYIDGLNADLEMHTMDSNQASVGVLTEIMSNDEESMNKAFKASIVSLDEDAGLSLKLSSDIMNEVFGTKFMRGKFMMIPAQQHKNKSGLLTSMFTDFLLSNYPAIPDNDVAKGIKYNKDMQLVDKDNNPTTLTKQPLMILFALEDSAEDVLLKMYQYLYTVENGDTDKTLDKLGKNVTDAQLSMYTQYVKTRCEAKGYSFTIVKINPNEWSYREFFNRIAYYKHLGYEIVAVFKDYLSLIPLVGCVKSNVAGEQLLDLYRKCRNFCDAENFLYISPVQLNTHTKKLLREEWSDKDFPKEIAGLGMTAGCGALDREPDMIMNTHLHTSKRGVTYQACFAEKSRGKRVLPHLAQFYIEFTTKDGPLIINNDTVKLVLPPDY